jgi:vacuolar-type H+-ATPase subunit E/Vma4
MKGIEKISEAILGKVKTEAQDIIEEAKEKARERIARAKEQQAAKLEEEKGKLIEEAREEATRTLAQSSISARQELLLAKTSIIDEIINNAKKTFSEISSNESSPLDLIKEAINALDMDKARIYVPPKDVSIVQKLIAGDKKLADRITEIKEFSGSGGVIAEDIDGKIRIDNTYDTRLEMLLPKLLPEIGKELFQDL